MNKILVSVLILSAVIGSLLYWRNSPRGGDVSAGSFRDELSSQYTEIYIHPTKHFSFRYPRKFTATSIPSGEGETILIQSTTTDMTVQISITPFQGSDIDITPDIIKSEIPGMKISESRGIPIGHEREGLMFTSDNEAFGGKSREIWFVFDGDIYQISTYHKFDDFLQSIFGTWEFE